MPELDFKGKEFVRNHHLTVPYRPLEPVPEKGIGEPDLTGNLIIHGDNLEALKALLPMYAGKVDCIFIDPPYNTGNEGWSYNDNVNSPVIKAWFTENPVGVDDALRHDKWCCMMWPRLKLLRELLAPTGVIFASIDDNEVHRMRLCLDEIFGDECFAEEIVWKNKYGPGAGTSGFGNVHEYILCYSREPVESITTELSEASVEDYRLRDEHFDTRGGYLTQPLMTRSKDDRPALMYSVRAPNGEEIYPEKQWIWERKRLERAIEAGEVVFRKNESSGKWSVRFKQYLRDEFGNVRKGKPISVWNGPFNQEGTWELESIFGVKDKFSNPKPSGLISRLLDISINGRDGADSIILDSFAGSGTTAHAVLRANMLGKETGRDKRKFILVEMEPYADDVTAERVRRIASGYEAKSAQKVVLLEKVLTWTELQKGSLLSEAAFSVMKENEDKFDTVEIRVDNGVLVVTGINEVAKMVPGTGGTFTYCELGRPIELDKLLSGGALPEREAVADYIIYLAGLDKNKLEQRKMPDDVKDWYLGSADGMHIWLLYRPDTKYLSSAASALTLEVAKALKAADPQARHRVYSPAKYVGTKILRDEKIDIEHVPLPLALFRGHTE